MSLPHLTQLSTLSLSSTLTPMWKLSPKGSISWLWSDFLFFVMTSRFLAMKDSIRWNLFVILVYTILLYLPVRKIMDFVLEYEVRYVQLYLILYSYTITTMYISLHSYTMYSLDMYELPILLHQSTTLEYLFSDRNDMYQLLGAYSWGQSPRKLSIFYFPNSLSLLQQKSDKQKNCSLISYLAHDYLLDFL